MPYISEKIKLPRELSRRVKIPIEMHEIIRQEYKEGKTSQRVLAKKYGVSRRLITFILSPEKASYAKLLYKARRKDKRYYNRFAHTRAVNSWRKYKQELYLKGILKK